MNDTKTRICCPSCSKSFRAKSKYFGKKVRCKCGAVFVVPQPAPASDVPAKPVTDPPSCEQPFGDFCQAKKLFEQRCQSGELPFADEQEA